MHTATSRGPRRRIIWTVLALVVIVLALGVYNAAVLPGCTSCHDRSGFRAATAASGHAKVDCRACHVPAGSIDRLGFALREPLHMFIPVTGGAERDAAAVPDSRCLTCHEDVEGLVSAANGLRIAHASCAVGSACTDCHSATAHGEATSWLRTYSMDRCLGCHIANEKTACDLCHESRRPAGRVKTGTFAITHGAQWRTTHGMGDAATCTICHQQDDCVSCHGPGLPHDAHFIEIHAEYSARSDAKCTGCHEQSFCDACHGTPMPHTAKFTAGHAAAASSQPDLCDRCHSESDCTVCHEKHVHPGGAVGGLPTGGAQ